MRDLASAMLTAVPWMQRRMHPRGPPSVRTGGGVSHEIILRGAGVDSLAFQDHREAAARNPTGYVVFALGNSPRIVRVAPLIPVAYLLRGILSWSEGKVRHAAVHAHDADIACLTLLILEGSRLRGPCLRADCNQHARKREYSGCPGKTHVRRSLEFARLIEQGSDLEKRCIGADNHELLEDTLAADTDLISNHQHFSWLFQHDLWRYDECDRNYDQRMRKALHFDIMVLSAYWSMRKYFWISINPFSAYTWWPLRYEYECRRNGTANLSSSACEFPLNTGNLLSRNRLRGDCLHRNQPKIQNSFKCGSSRPAANEAESMNLRQR